MAGVRGVMGAKGAVERGAFQSSLRDSGRSTAEPDVETPGYGRESLRDRQSVSGIRRQETGADFVPVSSRRVFLVVNIQRSWLV